MDVAAEEHHGIPRTRAISEPMHAERQSSQRPGRRPARTAKPPAGATASIRTRMTTPKSIIATASTPRTSNDARFLRAARRRAARRWLCRLANILVHQFEFAGAAKDLGLLVAPVALLRAEERQPTVLPIEQVEDEPEEQPRRAGDAPDRCVRKVKSRIEKMPMKPMTRDDRKLDAFAAEVHRDVERNLELARAQRIVEAQRDQARRRRTSSSSPHRTRRDRPRKSRPLSPRKKRA